MLSAITGILSGLVVVFIAWLAKQLFLSRRLFLIAPKLFDYSGLVSPGSAKTIELTLFNGGSRPEEEVRVQLSPTFRYTVIASDRPGMVVDKDGLLTVDRLAPKQEITVIMTAEGGEFRKEHVVGVSSKETVGKIKEGLQEAQLTPAQNFLIAFAVFGIIPFVGYLAGRFIEKEVWPMLSNAGVVVGEEKRVMLGFDIKKGVASGSFSAQKSAVNRMLGTVGVEKIYRVDDSVFIEVNIENRTEERLSYTVISTTGISERRSDYPGKYNYVESDVVAFPAASKVIELSDYLPQEEIPQVLVLKFIVEGEEGRAYRTDEIKLK